MAIYIIVAVLPLIFEAIFNEHERHAAASAKKWRWVYILISLLPLFAVVGFRGADLGADTGVYLNNFNNVSKTPWSELFDNTRMEYGYLVFVKLLGYIVHDARVYQVICALIYLAAMFTFSIQQKKSPFLFIYFFATLGLYTFMFTGTRQCLAMSICLFSYVFIRKRKIIPFILLVVLAYFFHKSSILFLVTYFIHNRKITWYNMLIYGGISALSVYYIENIQQFFNDALDYDYQIESTGSGGIFLALILGLTVMSYVVMAMYNKLTKESRGFFNIGVITAFFWILRIITRVAERPSYFFLFFSCALVAYALDAIPKTKERFYSKCAVCAVTMALYIYRFTTNYSPLVPYEAFF